jgi:superfamily I DNA and/or RNA helicase
MLNASLKDNRKILVCAPSNAAIDEIVTRLISKGGLLG